jgi:hypothetical protein
MKQVPFDSDKYFLRFDRKCVLHNQDEKLVSCSLKNWEKFVKTGFAQESLSKSHFRKLLHVLLTLTNWLKSKIFDGKQNSLIWFQSSHFSHIRSNFHSNSSLLDLQSSNAQMRLEGSKMGVYIVILGEGKLKGHQINGPLALGNIIGNLTLPQLIPHFGNLHWQMDNFGLPYRIELRFGT